MKHRTKHRALHKNKYNSTRWNQWDDDYKNVEKWAFCDYPCFGVGQNRDLIHSLIQSYIILFTNLLFLGITDFTFPAPPYTIVAVSDFAGITWLLPEKTLNFIFWKVWRVDSCVEICHMGLNFKASVFKRKRIFEDIYTSAVGQ